LGAIGFAKIEEDVLRRGLVAGRHHVQPLDRIGFIAGPEFVKPFGGIGELRKKLGGNFGADFIAATANGRADGGEQIGRLGLKLHLHLADGFDDDSRESTSPAGVNSGDGALLGIHDENRNAVSGLGAQEKTGATRDGGIALARLGGCGIKKMYHVRMDLLQGDKFEAGGVEGRLKAAAVFEDVFFGVPFGEAEIENFFAVLIADAARLGAEAVDEPGELGESRHLENSDAACAALGPRSSCAEGDARFASAVSGRYCFRGSHKSTSIIGVGCRTAQRSDGGVLIIGMGVDIAEVERIQSAIERYGETFLRRVFTTREREYCERFRNKYERYAGRFAAKEAAMKALGTGWRRGVRWVDLEVVRETGGRPTLAITGEAATIAQQIGVKSVALSITHTESQALAQVIFEG